MLQHSAFFLLLCSTFTFFPDLKLHQAARLSVISRETGRQLLYASLRDMMTSFLSPGYSRVTVAKVRVMSNVRIQRELSAQSDSEACENCSAISLWFSQM